jgi:hypothetical protein
MMTSPDVPSPASDRRAAVVGPCSSTTVQMMLTHSAQLSGASGGSWFVHHGAPSVQPRSSAGRRSLSQSVRPRSRMPRRAVLARDAVTVLSGSGAHSGAPGRAHGPAHLPGLEGTQRPRLQMFSSPAASSNGPIAHAFTCPRTHLVSSALVAVYFRLEADSPAADPVTLSVPHNLAGPSVQTRGHSELDAPRRTGPNSASGSKRGNRVAWK